MTANMRDRIGGWLLESGHTKERLAKMLDISTDTLRNRLSDTYEWSWTEVRKLAEILGCEVSDLQ